MPDPVRVAPGLDIPLDELTFSTSRSSGPGGQNVNKVETRVTVRFDVDASRALDTGQKERVRNALKGRITKEGVLQVSSDTHRTQAANRKAALERLQRLLAEAIVMPKERRPTRIPTAAKKRRLADKRHRAEVKKGRREPHE